jgi:hypothetical protein
MAEKTESPLVTRDKNFQIQNIPVSIADTYWNEKFVIPDLQRAEKSWGHDKRRLLIDSIFVGYDLPKFYMNVSDSEPNKYRIIDGLQRLSIIRGFLRNEFCLAKNGKIPTDMYGKYFKQLTEVQQEKIKNFILLFVIYRDLTDDDEETLFLRQNNGQSLTSAEKRNAIRGDFNNAAKELTKHPFLQNKLSVTTHKNVGNALCAQVMLFIINKGSHLVDQRTLWNIYHANKVWAEKKEVMDELTLYLDKLNDIFREKTKYIKKYNFLTFILFLYNRQQEVGILKMSSLDLFTFFDGFESARSVNSKDPSNTGRYGKILALYSNDCFNGPDSEASLTRRDNILKDQFYKDFPKMAKKLK